MKIVRAAKGNINRIERVFKFFRSSGSNGGGLPVGGTDGQSLIKSGVANFVAIWRALTSSDVGLENVTNHAQLKRSAGDFQAFTQKITPVDGDSLIGEDSSDGENKKRITLGSIVTLVFNRVASFLNYQAPKTSLAPANGATATVDVSTAYDYTITPSGATFTLDLTNIPVDETAWSVTIYCINWDGVTVTMPSGSVTSEGSGLTFTSGGGKDRIVARGNEGPSGDKEFYNLPGDMQ